MKRILLFSLVFFMASCHTLQVVDSSGIEESASANTTTIRENDYIMMLGRRGNYKPRQYKAFKQELFGASEVPKVPLNPAIIYVHPNGSNTTGTIGDITRPFQTLAGVNAVYTDELVYFMAGNYTEQVNLAIADGVNNRTLP